MRTAKQSSRGFTLVELLVVISIIGILVGMLIPAVMSAIRSSRRAHCMNNMRQAALGMEIHLSTHDAYPPGLVVGKTLNFHQVESVASGADFWGLNAFSAILPHIEEGRKYDQIKTCLNDASISNACLDCPGKTPAQVGTRTPATYVCPEASAAGTDYTFRRFGMPTGGDPSLALSKGSFALNFGSQYFESSLTDPSKAGMFGIEIVSVPQSGQSNRWMASPYGVRRSQIQDGATKTVLMSEVVAVPSQLDARGVWTWAGMGGSTFTGFQAPNDRNPDVLPICDNSVGSYTPNDPLLATQVRNGREVHAAARSEHTGGVNVMTAGGSGHFVSDTIDRSVWQALCTRAGVSSEYDEGIPE